MAKLSFVYHSHAILLQNTPEEVYQLMLDCWDDDHIKRPTFSIIEQRVDEILSSNRYVCTYKCSSSVADLGGGGS